MQLSNLRPNLPKKARKRKGQGNAAGQGTYAGRGCNGQNARAGGGVRIGFEGGQSSLLMRMPKLPGFTNPNRVEAQIVQLSTLDTHFKVGEAITPITLAEKGLCHPRNAKIKVLFDDKEPTKALTLEGLLISKKAKAAVEKTGGSVA